jgi:uncharacterized protein (TIGR03435 family)
MTAWMQIAGWVLVHFVWQGAVLGLVAALLLYSLRKQSAGVRYVIACSTLAVMLLTAVATAAMVRVNDANRENPRRVNVVLARQSPGDLAVALPIQLDVRPSGAGVRARTEAAFPWIVSIWLIGVVVLAARGAIGWWQVRRLHRLALSSKASTWQATGSRIAGHLGIARVVRIVEVPCIDVPFVIGCLRPVVVLPVAAMAQLNVMQVEAILAHELAHVRRHDYLVNLLQTLAETLFFYHPAIWWLSARIRDEREHCCDDVAVDVCGDPVGYAAALTELAMWRAGDVALAAAASGGSLIERVRRILKLELPQPPTAQWTLTFLVLVGLLTTAAAIVRSQAQGDEELSFEVASVRPNSSPDERKMMLGVQPGGRFTATNVSVFALIRSAYGLQEFQLIGGPEWISTATFDIMAKADRDFPVPVPGGPPSPAQRMLRSLLRDRFKLVVRRDTREMPIYALIRAREDGKLGSELKPSTIDCEAFGAARRGGGAPQFKPGERPVCGIRMGFGELAGGGFPLSSLASSLVQTVERIVVDRTGLSGNFDFYVRWTPERLPPGAPTDRPFRMNGAEIDPSGPSIFTALQEQLGLKLESTRGPVDVLVIDHVERPSPD